MQSNFGILQTIFPIYAKLLFYFKSGALLLSAQRVKRVSIALFKTRIYIYFFFKNCQLEVFRLNEATLWYEVLTNPEACCMKWVEEVDYIMPILSPKFLCEIHGKIEANENFGGLLPTSPVLNK